MAAISSGLRIGIANYLKTTFDKGIIRFFTGSPPASPNDAETGTLLAEITLNGAAFTPGQPGNGLEFDVVTDDTGQMKTYLVKSLSQLWQGLGLARGNIGYGRVYPNTMVTGASAAALRIDGNASSVGNADFIVSTTQVVPGVPVVVTYMRLVVNGRK